MTTQIPQNTSQDISKLEIKIAITTPYLYQNLEEFKPSVGDFNKEIDIYKYNPNNLHNTKFLETDKYRIHLENPKEHTAEKPEYCHLVIAGCTADVEQEIFRMKSSGALVARYSIFYGKPSGYTNIKPENAGYAFDIPKDVDTIKAMLTNDQLLEAILEREENKIQQAISTLNQQIATPILITPYLTQALQIKPLWKTGIEPPQPHPIEQMFDYVGLRLGIEDQ